MAQQTRLRAAEVLQIRSVLPEKGWTGLWLFLQWIKGNKMRSVVQLTCASLMSFLAMPAYAQFSQVITEHNVENYQTGQNSVKFFGGFFSADIVKQSGDPTPFGAVDFHNGSVLLTEPPDDPTRLDYQTQYIGSVAELNSSYPDGEYKFRLIGGDSLTTNIPGFIYPTTVPEVANFDALSKLDPTQAFTVNLKEGFVPQGDQSFTFFTIIDQTSGNLVYRQDFQSPFTTSFYIGPDTLTAEHSYRFETVFDNRFASPASDGATPAFHLFDTRTFGDFTVAAAVPEPGSWAMLIVGFGLIGSTLRRRGGRGMVMA